MAEARSLRHEQLQPQVPLITVTIVSPLHRQLEEMVVLVMVMVTATMGVVVVVVVVVVMVVVVVVVVVVMAARVTAAMTIRGQVVQPKLMLLSMSRTTMTKRTTMTMTVHSGQPHKLVIRCRGSHQPGTVPWKRPLKFYFFRYCNSVTGIYWDYRLSRFRRSVTCVS